MWIYHQLLKTSLANAFLGRKLEEHEVLRQTIDALGSNAGLKQKTRTGDEVNRYSNGIFGKPGGDN